MPSSSNSSGTQRPSKFKEHINDETQDKIDEATFLQQKYPKQWKRLDWEARGKDENEEYCDEDVEDDAQSIHVSWHENTTTGSSKNGGRNGERPKSPILKTRKVKVAQRLAVAKKMLCFGSVTPEEEDFGEE
ncbi:hypothetical protein SBOR_5681 [Sclerotinia borealis F-4128]|uniref:Uncharacterized protein n=1 Tax=Sclerotinia borealis (strain F-4128) TaxID=1432307 RepID=W9CB03_SCLBF|nr:hypothetical protein SBOR_5681 [Sclerotinia borealis F-4128]